MKKLILKCGLSPGDIVMLTAAVRDLHRTYPGQFLTDVRTSCPALWHNNPYLTHLEEHDPEVESIDCLYPLINHCNQLPYHCIHGFAAFLSERLNLPIKLSAFKGDIHVSELEKSWMSQVHELTGEDTPFWIVVAGGKYDVTIKWWSASRYQQVIDHFRGKLQFVQVGARHHYHPRLEGVIDLRGKTNLRQLVRLVYHAQGVLCPVTSLMHLAAAVEFKGHPGIPRPCVVVAGGREPAHWEAYPGHQFIHTNGALPCCQRGGCWKARTTALHDGDERDHNLCLQPIDRHLPKCMDLITAEEVIRRIELHLTGGAVQYLSPAQAKAVEIGVQKTLLWRGRNHALTLETARSAAEKFIRGIPDSPGGFSGRGIVICAGGRKYLTSAWVCIKMLRSSGCQLPIQVWHLGPREMSSCFKELLKSLQVECIDAETIRLTKSARILNGWELKAYAILHSPYAEVLLLDADNVPILDPTLLFETPEFRKLGALFWPDYGKLSANRLIWDLCGVPYRDEPEFESGQILVDKARCWKALCLAMWYNEHSDFFYRHIHGDKDTFHLAFRKLNTPYAMPSTPIHSLHGVMCQHDFSGRRIFQHRNFHKWTLDAPNKRIEGFLHEEKCLQFLEELRQKWV